MSKNDMTMEIKYVVPFAGTTPVFNVEEMKTAAKRFADKYTGLVVTKDTYADCKVACAEQNAVIGKLKEIKTELNRKAKELVAPAIKTIDDILAIVEPPYKELHDGILEIKDSQDREKVDAMTAYAGNVATARFPELTAAGKHLKSFVDEKCRQKRDGWLTKRWTLEAINEEIDKEAERMAKAMDFINAHTKNATPDIQRVAKTALINNAFNELIALEASDKYAKTLEEQKRMELVKRGKDPDAIKPAPKPEPPKSSVVEPIAADNRICTATVEFTAPVDEMKKLVALIKQSGVKYKVINQTIVK